MINPLKPKGIRLLLHLALYRIERVPPRIGIHERHVRKVVQVVRVRLPELIECTESQIFTTEASHRHVHGHPESTPLVAAIHATIKRYDRVLIDAKHVFMCL